MRNRILSLFVALCALSPLAAQAQTAPVGDPGKGRGMWMGAGGSGMCGLCHGMQAGGSFGPDLAGGRGLTFEQFKRAVRQPWGVMPSYPKIDDQGLAHLYAFLKSLPPSTGEKVPNWSVSNPPAGAPLGQVLGVQFGCGQCHGPEIGHPRRDIGEKAKGFDFEHFKKIIYETAPLTMGQFNKDRLSEPVAREIYNYMLSSGWRTFLWATSTIKAEGANQLVTINLENKGEKDKGLAGEDIMVSVLVPAGFTAVSGTGGKYEGVTKGVEYTTNPGVLSPFRLMNPNPQVKKDKGDFAIFRIKKMEAGAKESVSLTLSGPGFPNLTGSTITWGKPAIKRPAGVTLTDDRLAARGDVLWAPSPEFTLPPTPKPAATAAAK